MKLLLISLKIILLLYLVIVPSREVGAQNINLNLLTCTSHPKNSWINSIIIKDSILYVNISANNVINDSTFVGWINLDSNTFLRSGNQRSRMIAADGISIAPSRTNFTRPNQTISFTLKFSAKNISGKSFDLIENESSEWKFIGIKLFEGENRDVSSYYAPHIIARNLSSITDSLMRVRKFEEVIQTNSLVVSFIQKNEIKEDVLLATSSYNLAGGYNNLRNDSLTAIYANKTIDLYKDNKWKANVALARMYGVVADVYAREGNFVLAIKQGEEALRIKNALYPNGSSDLALTYGKLATYYERIEDFDNAILHAEKGLLVREQTKGSRLIDRLPVVINLCRHYFVQQRYADALQLAMAYKTDMTKETSINAYIDLCAVCSHSYGNLGNENNAKTLAKEGYDLINHFFPSDHSKLLNYLEFLPLKEKILIQELYLKNSAITEFHLGIMQNLSGDYFTDGRIDEAIKMQELCTTQREKYSIRNSIKECEGQNHLLSYYFFSGNEEKYLLLKNNCLNLTESTFGKYSYEYSDLLRTSFYQLYNSGNYFEAYMELQKVLDVYKYLIIRDFSLLSYDDRELLWNTYNNWFDETLLDCYLHALASNPTKVDELNGLLYDNVLFSKGFFLNSQIANNAHILMSNTLDERMQNSDAITTILKNNLYGSYSDILKKMDSESIAIEFIHAENTGEIIALCLSSEKDYPIFEYVCKEDEINNLMKEKASPQQYSTLLWGNLFKHLKGKRYIYISLDGVLNIIPIESYSHDNHFFAHNTQFFRLSSTRNLNHTPEHRLNNVLLVGNLTYDNNSSTKWENLPETSVEIDSISKLLQNGKMNYTLIKGKDGTKDFIVSQLGNNYSAIHLATHSFYWKEEKEINTKIESILKSLTKTHKTDARLIRSGIVLSSNGSKEQEHNSEILTSYDIAGLNLNNVQLVVLPNCKSGLGDITKDGVIGLQRAFKEAQVGTILMSLWNADEISTRLLMVEFYKNYLSGKSLHQSLQEAQDYIKNYTDDSGTKLFASPYYWAGFVLLD